MQNEQAFTEQFHWVRFEQYSINLYAGFEVETKLLICKPLYRAKRTIYVLLIV